MVPVGHKEREERRRITLHMDQEVALIEAGAATVKPGQEPTLAARLFLGIASSAACNLRTRLSHAPGRGSEELGPAT